MILSKVTMAGTRTIYIQTDKKSHILSLVPRNDMGFPLKDYKVKKNNHVKDIRQRRLHRPSRATKK